MPVYRGGEKFNRALSSVRAVEPFFRRIVISLNSTVDSPDQDSIEAYRAEGPTKIEVVQTGREIPWIPHQYFWLNYLETTGESTDAWIMWFAHDDELRLRGLEALVDQQGSWPLESGVIYLGPWGMRYDPPGALFDGDRSAPLESWTSFPIIGPQRMSVAEWICAQLEQPTYINMSGCVTQLASFKQMRGFLFNKPGGMRIEMATAAAPANHIVQEFNEPLVITYTSKGSDRTTYAAVARRDDAHLLAWLGNYMAHHPDSIPAFGRTALRLARHSASRLVRSSEPVAEDWRYRSTVEP